MSRSNDKEKLVKWQLENFHTFLDHVNSINLETGKQIQCGPDDLMCPICWKICGKEDFAMEHAPPKSIGGKGVVLTCKKCNSTAGDSYEHRIKERVACDAGKWVESYLPNAFKGKASIENIGEMKVRFNANNKGEYALEFQLLHGRNHVQKKLMSELRSNNLAGKKINGSGEFKLPPNKRHSYNSLVKSAYVLVFSYFGYGLMMNPNLINVRRKLLHCDEEILPMPMGVMCDFLCKEKGVFVYENPGVERGYLVVFDTKSDKEGPPFRYGVVLPGPDEIGKNVYNRTRFEENLHPINKGIYKKNMEYSIWFNACNDASWLPEV
jgi:hypothetical protein